MDKLRNLSIRRSIIAYIFISLLVSFSLWMLAYRAAFKTQMRWINQYAAEEIGYGSVYPERNPFDRQDVYIVPCGGIRRCCLNFCHMAH